MAARISSSDLPLAGEPEREPSLSLADGAVLRHRRLSFVAAEQRVGIRTLRAAAVTPDTVDDVGDLPHLIEGPPRALVGQVGGRRNFRGGDARPRLGMRSRTPDQHPARDTRRNGQCGNPDELPPIHVYAFTPLRHYAATPLRRYAPYVSGFRQFPPSFHPMTSRRQFVASSAALLGAASLRSEPATCGSSSSRENSPRPSPRSPRCAIAWSPSPSKSGRPASPRRAASWARTISTRSCSPAGLRSATSPGIEWWLSERLLTVVIPREGAPVHRVPGVRARPGPGADRLRSFRGDADIMPWEEHENPWALLATGLRDRGAATGRDRDRGDDLVGLQRRTREGAAHRHPHQRHAGHRGLPHGEEPRRARADAAGVGGDPQGLQGGLAVPARRHDAGGIRRAGPAGARAARLRRRDAGVQVGPASALPHGSAKPQVVREGTILLIDGGCSVGGYASDLSRTFVLGKATDRMKQVFDIELRAQTAALRTARPGCPLRGGRRRGSRGDRGCGIRPGVQVLHPPRGPRDGHGRPRVALPREGEHAARSRPG